MIYNAVLVSGVKQSESTIYMYPLKTTASGPVISWQIDAENMETEADFSFLGSKITVDGDCSHEIKRRLFLERKAMTNLDSILKSRDSTLLTKGACSQRYGFSCSHRWI